MVAGFNERGDHPIDLGVELGDAGLKLWDPQQPDTPVATFDHGGDLTAVAIGAGGQVVTAGYSEGRAKLWDPQQPDTPVATFDHGGGVTAVAVDAGGRVVTGGNDSTAKLWRRTGDLVAALTLDSDPRAVGFARNGDLVVIDKRLAYHRLTVRGDESPNLRDP